MDGGDGDGGDCGDIGSLSSIFHQGEVRVEDLTAARRRGSELSLQYCTYL